MLHDQRLPDLAQFGLQLLHLLFVPPRLLITLLSRGLAEVFERISRMHQLLLERLPEAFLLGHALNLIAQLLPEPLALEGALLRGVAHFCVGRLFARQRRICLRDLRTQPVEFCDQLPALG
ncbi:hypothetical protein VI03_24750 [Burkholderia vietnamiensis]|nr:hypothetical protein VI03_24750 [Burkholderia vietnamiensis]